MKDLRSEETESKLLKRVLADDADAVNELLNLHRDRLKGMVRLRLSPQLQRRVDESDIVQESLIDAGRKLKAYAARPRMPFYLWIRNLTALKLLEAHRRHLATDKRDVSRENSLPQASSILLADQLSASLTSPSQAAIKNEARLQLQRSLEAMDDIDREVLVLRHFEQLSTSETAQILGISKSTAGSRYLRALDRLRETFDQFSA